MLGVLLALAATAVGGFWWLTKVYPWLPHDLRYLRILIKTIVQLLKVKSLLYVDLMEKWAKLTPDKTFLIYEDSKFTYREADEQSNRVANAAKKLGLKCREDVAVLMYNEPEFLWTFFGLSKLGVFPAFLNYNLRSKALLHCLQVSSAKILFVGKGIELFEAVKQIYPDLKEQGVKVYVQGTNQNDLPDGFFSFDDLLSSASSTPIDKRVREGLDEMDILCYIFTSGTTGLPKAAIVSNRKGKLGGGILYGSGARQDDVIYTPLPLYHSAAGLIALGGTLLTGATLVLGRKFSATKYWDECRKHNVTVIQYIGELCRYLLAKPQLPSDRNHNIKIAIGNGLRRDIWEEFQNRFNIPTICEFYAATEGNSGYINTANKAGAIGRTSPLIRIVQPIHLVKFDIIREEVVRNDEGFCIQCKPGEVGIAVGRIVKKLTPFDGYKGNNELTSKKTLTNVFKKEDVYFNTGDLLVTDELGYVYFHDRVGDTFRWKGENVSTTEVANVMTSVSWIEDSNVYGVSIPGQDGKAGMACLTLVPGHKLEDQDLEELYKHCAEYLPTYAHPKFLRIVSEQQVTATLKQQKFDLVKQSFDPDTCKGDPLYFVDNVKKTFSPLTKPAYEDIVAAKIKF